MKRLTTIVVVAAAAIAATASTAAARQLGSVEASRSVTSHAHVTQLMQPARHAFREL
jgi:hypothetical protein